MPTLEELKYPIGRFQPTVSAMPGIRAAQIQSLRQLPTRLRQAVDGLTADQLLTPYRDGGWSLLQTVHHVADSHANAFIRFKLALTEDWPTVKPYDEAAWARLADSTQPPVAVSLSLIDALHARWATLLDSLSDDDLQQRGYVHPVNGRQTLAHALGLYDWHGRHHTAHITQLRAAQGW